MLAAIYFLICFALAWISGVTRQILDEPLVHETQLGSGMWWLATAIVTAHVLFAYAWFWPRGTVTFDRPSHPVVSRLFGLLWGAAQGQLILALIFAVENFELADLWTYLIVVAIWSNFAGLWQSQFWDVYVSPEHNIPEWNVRKVLVAHVPYLLLSVAHYMTFRNAGLFVIWQIIALTASASRFSERHASSENASWVTVVVSVPAL